MSAPFNLDLKGQAENDQLLLQILSCNNIDSTRIIIQGLKSGEREKIFDDLINILKSDTLDENKIGFVLCYFDLHPTKETINFLLDNLSIGLIISEEVTSCRPYDVLISIGKPAFKITKKHIVSSTTYLQFHTQISIIRITGKLNDEKTGKLIDDLSRKSELMESYCQKWKNGDI